LFGDITSEQTGILLANQSISTGIILSGGFNNKNIFLQYWTGEDFATHYAESIDYQM
jgi:hypothetical protein